MDNNAEKAYEDGFVAGMQHDAESRVSKFIAASMREWVGLTDEEMRVLLDEELYNKHANWLAVCRSIEAKLKDKNNG